jgi:4-carboxymuconolactone decarboxylase
MRLSEPTLETMTEAQREAVAEATAGVRGRIPGPMRAWIHSPTMASRAQLLGAFLRYETTLAPAISEFAILLTARSAACSYVWHAHAKEALRGGLDPTIIDHLASGIPLQLSDPTLRIVHDYVSALLATHRVPQALHDAAVAILGETGVVELVGVIGYYSLVALTVNAFALELQPGAKPLFD